MLGLNNLFNALTTKRSNKKDKLGNTLLYTAVKEGSVKKVKQLLKEGADPNITNVHQLTPLHQAAYWGETEIVALLLKHGARVDADNGKGWTALHSAAIAGGNKNRKEIIRMLLEKGADASKPDKFGWTPKDYMSLWESGTDAAEKLKKYTDMLEGKNPPPPPRAPAGPSPKH